MKAKKYDLRSYKFNLSNIIKQKFNLALIFNINLYHSLLNFPSQSEQNRKNKFFGIKLVIKQSLLIVLLSI